MTRIADHSYLSYLLDCPRAFFHKYVEGIEPKTDAIRLKAGSAMHKGLAVIHETNFEEIDRAVDSLAKEYSAAVPMGDMEFLTTGHLETVLRNYCDHWKGRDPYRVVEMIEEPVIQEIDGMVVGGIPDMVVEEDGELIILDHKTTTSYLGSHLYNRVKFSKQFPIYCLLLSEKLGKPVRRAVCNAVFTGKNATNPKTKATLFDRYSFEYSEGDLEEATDWIRTLIYHTTDFYGAYNVNQVSWYQDFPQHGGSHCGWCDYKEICEVAPVLRDGVKKTRFRVREVTGKLLSGADS